MAYSSSSLTHSTLGGCTMLKSCYEGLKRLSLLDFMIYSSLSLAVLCRKNFVTCFSLLLRFCAPLAVVVLRYLDVA